MPSRDSEQQTYPMIEVVLNSIADWVSRYRRAIDPSNGFGDCGPDEVMQIAKDIGVPAGELRELARKGPGAADLLQKMLVALGVDPKALANTNPLVMRDLQRLCAGCADKKLCVHELADGTAAQHYHDFCPNAFTLDALFQEKLAAAKP